DAVHSGSTDRRLVSLATRKALRCDGKRTAGGAARSAARERQACEPCCRFRPVTDNGAEPARDAEQAPGRSHIPAAPSPARRRPRGPLAFPQASPSGLAAGRKAAPAEKRDSPSFSRAFEKWGLSLFFCRARCRPRTLLEKKRDCPSFPHRACGRRSPLSPG